MKALQVVILVAVLLGGVFGLTFLTQYTRKPIERAGHMESGPRTEPLRLTEKVAVWDVSSDSSLAKYEYAEFEKGTKGHYDFWVLNRNPESVAARVLYQSCNCFDIKLGIVPPRELVKARSEAQSRQAVLAAALGIVGVPELAIVGAMPDLANVIQWRPLVHERDRPPVAVPVPPADPVTGPQLAVLRFGWEVQTAQAIRLEADIQHQISNNSETTRFEVPLLVVPPLQVAPALLQFDDLHYNDQREATFYVWSATRPSIDIHVENLTPDPCIEVSAPVPLTERELKDLPRALLEAGHITQLTRMRCGYAVKVTVHEHRGEHQLELGPLTRRVLIKLDGAGSEDDVSVILAGVVRGAVRVGAPSDRDRIDLGSFRANRPHEKTVLITATDPGIKLQIAGKSPDSLLVELKEQSAGLGQKRWLLRVEVPPNSFSGILPRESAIYLQTEGDQPRRIRIPILGMATH